MYLIECLEVDPAQAGTARAAFYILLLMTTASLTTAQMGHCHLANPAPHDKSHMQFCCTCCLQTGTMTDQTSGIKVQVWSLVYEWASCLSCC